MAGEEAQRVAGVHHERLFVRHRGEVLHHKAVLGPVLEDCTVATVDDELVRMLGYTRVQIVLYHCHDGGRLTGFGGILVDGAGVHFVRRPETIHVNAAVLLELLREFLRKLPVMPLREVSEGVFYGENLLLVAKDVLTLGSMID